MKDENNAFGFEIPLVCGHCVPQRQLDILEVQVDPGQPWPEILISSVWGDTVNRRHPRRSVKRIPAHVDPHGWWNRWVYQCHKSKCRARYTLRHEHLGRVAVERYRAGGTSVVAGVDI